MNVPVRFAGDAHIFSFRVAREAVVHGALIAVPPICIGNARQLDWIFGQFRTQELRNAARFCKVMIFCKCG